MLDLCPELATMVVVTVPITSVRAVRGAGGVHDRITSLLQVGPRPLSVWLKAVEQRGNKTFPLSTGKKLCRPIFLSLQPQGSACFSWCSVDSAAWRCPSPGRICKPRGHAAVHIV